MPETPAEMAGLRPGRWWASLRGRLLILALVVFLPLFGLAVYQALATRGRALAEARELVAREAEAAERELAAVIASARRLLHAMAANPALRGEDRAACAAALADHVKQDRRYISLLVVGPDGKLLCHSDAAAPPTDYSDRDYFKRALETRETVVGTPVIGRIARRPLIPVARPILDAGGEVQRVLVAALDLAWIGEHVAGITAAPHGVIAMCDGEGRVLFRHPDKENWAGRDAPDAPVTHALRTRRPGEPFEVEGLDGAMQVVAFEHSREHPEGALIIRVGVPRGALTRPADRDLAAVLATLTLVAASALVAMFLLAERFVRRPVAALVHASAEIGRGNLSVRVPEPEFRGEMRELAVAFNGAATALAASTEALRSSEAQLRTIVESLAEGVVVSDLEGRLMHLNRAAIEMNGFAHSEEYLRALPEFADTFELSGPDGTVWPVDEWPLACVLRGEVLHDLEVHVRRKPDGWQRVFAYGGALARDASGKPLMAVVTIRDITERKRSEARIRSQLEHLRLLDHITRSIGERQDLKSIFQVVVRSVEDSLPLDFGCVCLHDAAANALTVASVGAKSEALAHELAMDEHSAIDVDANGLGRCMGGELVYEPDIAELRFPFPQRLARGGLGAVVMAPLRSESKVFGVLVAARREPEAFSSGECEFLRQLSEHVALAAHQAQLHSALQQAYDDLRRTQQSVIQQERLRALGQMASGIAHDINNTLSPVSLYAESLLETEPGLSARACGYLETIQRAVDDVAETVARLREFYRPREMQLEFAPVDLNQLARQVIELTRARWRDMLEESGVVVRATTELAPDLPRIMGVESEIREALTNLVFNAVDALPEGGVFSLRTRVLGGAAGGGGEAVAIEVIDKGVGMDEEARTRCLEPFFTTKGERGTGLGLAMVYGVAQRHGAKLEIDSAPGAGTTVRLVFAVRASLPAAAEQRGAEPERPSRLHLLLIDDDRLLLISLRDALERDGHALVTAHGGEAGVAVFRESLAGGEPFDAVITDLGMPNVDGRKVAAAVKEVSPATPVILLTGWGQRLAADADIPAHVDRVLAKPPKLREVRETLAQLCARAAG